jgi:hypothetical protein
MEPTPENESTPAETEGDGKSSVAAARSWHFCILRNKIDKNLKIFVQIDEIKSQGVLCQL